MMPGLHYCKLWPLGATGDKLIELKENNVYRIWPQLSSMMWLTLKLGNALLSVFPKMMYAVKPQEDYVFSALVTVFQIHRNQGPG